MRWMEKEEEKDDGEAKLLVAIGYLSVYRIFRDLIFDEPMKKCDNDDDKRKRRRYILPNKYDSLLRED